MQRKEKNMQKIKFVIGLSAFSLICLFSTKPAVAANISITQLPGYISTNNFKLSYSCLGCTSVQFYVNKNGTGDVAFGPAMTDASGQVQVTSTEVNDQTSYKFTVTDAGIGSATTTTVYDTSGPDPVTGFSKDGLSDGVRLHYHTPTNEDFSRVIIYRGDTLGFEADSSHEIATVTSSRDSDMTFEDHYGSSLVRYHLIRAIDKAGNSSSLVGDGGQVTTTQVTASPLAGNIIVLPKDTGSVLGTEATESPTPDATIKPTLIDQINQYAGDKSGLYKWILTHKKISIGLAIVLILLTYRIYKFSNQNHINRKD
jgi:hypothetical protein